MIKRQMRDVFTSHNFQSSGIDICWICPASLNLNKQKPSQRRSCSRHPIRAEQLNQGHRACRDAQRSQTKTAVLTQAMVHKRKQQSSESKQGAEREEPSKTCTTTAKQSSFQLLPSLSGGDRTKNCTQLPIQAHSFT